jgi:preprotein translocase SecE subunit
VLFYRMSLVRQEATKVSWPSYREALVSSAIVLSLMGLAGMALWVIDYCLGMVDRLLLTF